MNQASDAEDCDFAFELSEAIELLEQAKDGDQVSFDAGSAALNKIKHFLEREQLRREELR